MNWFKKLFRKKPEARPVSREEIAHVQARDAAHARFWTDKSLPPQDVETICREEDGATTVTPFGIVRWTFDPLAEEIYSRMAEITRLKRNKKKFSHLQAELEELTR